MERNIMLPRVIIHNAVSLDGRIDQFPVDIGLYYELAMRWKEDATLAGANTILAPKEKIPEEDESAFQELEQKPDDERPILVIPDSQGRVRIWHFLRVQPYWRQFVSLVSKATPDEYLEYLNKRHIDYIICGEEKVYLRAALEELNNKYGVRTVRVDSGGTLNGVLLKAGLVDEVSVLVHPSLVGGSSLNSIFRGPDPTSPDGALELKLTHQEKLNNDVVWLRYEVVKNK